MSDWEPNSDLIFTQKRSKMFLALVCGLILLATMIWVGLNPEVIDEGSSSTRRGRQGDALISLMGDNAKYLFWAATAFMIYLVLVALFSLFKPAQLKLNSKGLLISKLFKEKFYAWNDISPLTYKQLKAAGAKSEEVFFKTDIDGQQKKVRVPMGFSMKAQELTLLINEFRDRSIIENEQDADIVASTPVAQNDIVQTSSSDDWQPPSNELENYGVRAERAPIGRWVLSGLLLLSIIAGAIWLTSKVVVPDSIPKGKIELPTADKNDENKPEPVKKSSDEEAWIKALEKDTLEGYREYLTLFPEGKFKEDAQKEINAYDNRAWATTEQRNTLAGYEDYLEAWPEGLHASKARERIAEIKAKAEAIAKDAAERAARDKTDWETAATTNTIDSYGRYLTQHPTGQYIDEAQKRIDRIKADQASAAALAADRAAWDQAKAANRVDSYQQYLTSYPQGAFVPQAIAAMEQLKPAPGRVFQDCDVCPPMVSVPSGNANLGAGDNETDARPNEKPQRPVTISNLFAMGVTEVTFAEYGACVSAGGCGRPPSDNGWGQGRRPVINVSWNDAQKYVSWLSSKSGFSYSLPSEAQWEYAARGGETGALIGGSAAAICAFANGAGIESGLKWGNGDCSDPSSDRTLPVGTLGKNKFGLKDMIGNVAEWTQDCNTLNLRDAPTDGRADERGSCNQRVVRGGSWFSGPADLRYAARLMQRRGDSNDFTGFRVVRRIDN